MAVYYVTGNGTESPYVPDCYDGCIGVNNSGVYSAEYASETDDSGSVGGTADNCGVSRVYRGYDEASGCIDVGESECDGGIV